jgi:hypothetical protein
MAEYAMLDTTLDQLDSMMTAAGPEATIASLASQLQADSRWQELFELRLLEARRRFGLPLVATTPLDDLEEPLRTQMEQAYLEACREIGHRLLAVGEVRQAWMYLRPVGDKAAVRQALEQLPAEDHYEAIIELAVYEGVAPDLGFQLVLDHYGLCNAISLFDAQMEQRPRSEKQAVAARLVRFLHRDLLEAVRSDIQRQQGSPPVETTLGDMVRQRDWLFAEDMYHVDTTHLNAVVRFALLVDDPEVLRLALDLTEYGRRLSPQFQFPGDEPFVEMYETAGRFIGALLGIDVEAAVAWFAERAETRPAHEFGTAPAEVYISLLARLGRYDAAVRAAGQLLPAETRGGGFAPNLLELAQQGQQYTALREVSRQRGDSIGYLIGLLGEAR